MKRVMALGAAVLALGAGGAAFGQKATAGGAAAAQADGGLAVSVPEVIDAPAKAGAYGPVKVSNRSATAMTVTVAPRQWTQAANGKVSPNRRGALAGVSVERPELHARAGRGARPHGQRRLDPGRGSLYGALEVVGLPTDVATRKGVVLGYRVVRAIRLNPAAPKPASPRARSSRARARPCCRSRTRATRSTR